jgi:hypothetical protein
VRYHTVTVTVTVDDTFLIAIVTYCISNHPNDLEFYRHNTDVLCTPIASIHGIFSGVKKRFC